MKTPILFLLFAISAFNAPISLCAAQDSRDVVTDDVGWPRSYTVENAEIVLDLPRVEKWQDSILQARFAVSIKPAGEPRALLGSFTARADTITNSEARTVAIYNITAQDVQFPDSPGSQAAFSRLINALAPEKPVKVSLDKLLAAVPSDDIVTKNTVLTETRNNAPRIIVSNAPAVLLAFDGPPIFRLIPGSGLEAAVNTPATVLRPEGRKSPLYLLTNDGLWLNAEVVQGPWQRMGGPPTGLERIPADHPVALAVKSVSPAPGAVINVPDVVMTEEPAEMIQLDGKPNYKRIGDLPLVRVGNTESPLFYHFDLSAFYVLISGRWFTAQELRGPWVYVSNNSVPVEFGEIPANDPSAYVRVSVTGTREAEEAVKEAQIPVQARVKIREAPTIEVDYDGEPIFEEIRGTDLYYAVNTSYEVLRIGPSYYCCHDGIWFIADRPFGSRWSCATSLPRAIYTIPPSCPLYHTRFCDIESYADDEVVYRYSAGYYGTYIDPDTQVCIYGTGYRYQPYVSDSYYCGHSWTYGLGSNYRQGYGFANESHHVARTNWYQEDRQRDRREPAVWRGSSGSHGLRTTDGRWQSMTSDSAPYSRWTRGVTTHHEEVAQRFARNAPAADRPRVIAHGRADERSASVFKKDPQVTREQHNNRETRGDGLRDRNPTTPKKTMPLDLGSRGEDQLHAGRDPAHHQAGRDIGANQFQPSRRDEPRTPIATRQDRRAEQLVQPTETKHDRGALPENPRVHQQDQPKGLNHDRVVEPDNSRGHRLDQTTEPKKKSNRLKGKKCNLVLSSARCPEKSNGSQESNPKTSPAQELWNNPGPCRMRRLLGK